MSEETIICPECGSDQPASAPFCDNCGFRLRTAETVREMLGPEERARLGEFLKAESTPRPARKMMALSEDTEAEEEVDVTSMTLEEAPFPATSTLLEGVRAVEAKTLAMEAVAFHDPEHAANTPEPAPEVEDEADDKEDVNTPGRPRRAPAPRSTRGNAVVWGAVALCAVAMASLSWIHVQRADASDHPVAIAPPRIIEIEEGAFLRGLSREAQSYIMQLCQRVNDDGGDRCERDQLLPGEFPQQTVRMPAFGIDSGPVRNQDYEACVASQACTPVDFDDCHIWTPQGRQIGVRMPQALRRDDRPVVCVTRAQARAYCQAQGGDLPSHSQWEKAARGREGSLFPWGEFWSYDMANWGERDIMGTTVAGRLDGHAWTSPPGAFPDGRSPFGLDDMAGNVAEWVLGDDEIEGHVRGGSWISDPFDLRTTARVSRDARQGRTDIGFRCAYSR